MEDESGTWGLLPPLQKFNRLQAQMLRQSKITEALESYLKKECCNLAEWNLVSQFCEKKGINISSIDKSHIELRSKEWQNKMDLEIQKANEANVVFGEEMKQAAARGEFKWFVGAPSNPSNSPQVFMDEVWQLDSRTPLGKYRLKTLHSAAKAVRPYLLTMRKHFYLDDEKTLIDVYNQGVSDLSNYESTDCQRVFGHLELLRHLFCLKSSTLENLKTIENSIFSVESAMRSATKCLEQIQLDMDDHAAKKLPTANFRCFREACILLLIEYSMFFNVFLSFLDFLKGDFQRFLHCLSPKCSSFIGFYRFPNILNVAVSTREGEPVPNYGRNTFNGLPFQYYPLSSRPVGDLPLSSATNVPFLSSALVVANVLQPVTSFASALTLSALACLPLQEALFSVNSLPDLQCMINTSSELKGLLGAAETGNFKTTVQLGVRAHEKFVSTEAFFDESSKVRLLERFKYGICFNAVVAFQRINIDRACDLVGMKEDELIAILKVLISRQVLTSRINLVDRTICSQSVHRNTQDGVWDSVVQINKMTAEMEEQLRNLSIERNFITPSIASLTDMK